MQDMPTWRVSRAGGGIGPIGAQVGSENRRTRRARLWGMLLAVKGRHGCGSCQTRVCVLGEGELREPLNMPLGACFFLFEGRCWAQTGAKHQKHTLKGHASGVRRKGEGRSRT